MPAVALIFAGMKANDGDVDIARSVRLPALSERLRAREVLFSLASEMTKSCLACGRWQVKQALLLALAFAFGRPSGVNTAYSQSPLRGQSAG